MKIFYRILIFVFLCQPPLAAYSAPRSELDTMIQRYEELNLQDPAGKKIAEWTNIKKGFETALLKEPNSKSTAAAQYYLGAANERLFKTSGHRRYLDDALQAYERVARRHPRTEFADDALLALGDLRRNVLKDEVAARAAYFEIIDEYPQGDAVKLAKSRLSPSKAAPTATQTPQPSPTSSPTPLSTAAPTPSPKPSADSKTNQPTPTPTPLPPPGTGEQLISRDEIYHRPLIVIDPGHGGDDHGAKGVDNILEKDVVLDIAKEFGDLLSDRLRAKTFLTRSTDVFIPLQERTKLANDKNADLFISIHANASEYRTAHGIETYYLDNTKDKSSLKLAERENATASGELADALNPDVGFMFSDLIQNVKQDDSISLAHLLQDSITSTLSRYYQDTTNLGVKKAPFYVLVGAHMPCVLVEVSFIDHPMEGKRLGDKRYQRLIAQALYEGVKNFFAKREKGK